MVRQRHSSFHTPVLVALAFIAAFAGRAEAAGPAQRSGATIFSQMCARCHGNDGQGVKDKYEEPLGGDGKSLRDLEELIAKSMPDDKPGTCVGDDAKAVASYVHDRFYSADARARLALPKRAFARLTVPQYRNSVADIIASFRNTPAVPQPGGLSGEYFASKAMRKGKAALERVDADVEFSFGPGTPDAELFPGEEFGIRWQGSVIAEETGNYEFVVRSEIGVRLWLNSGATDGSKPLIDESVSSGVEPREHKKSVFLIGGRAYPIRLEAFRSREKTASVALRWKPPHGTLRAIPPENLSPSVVPPVLVVSTPFPADDRSSGYDRGTSISKAWEQATVAAAIEAADQIIEQLDALSGSSPDAADRTQKLKAFAGAFAERAYRRPLTGAERALFRDKAFEGAKEAEGGVRRAVMLALMSPRFLYPEAASSGSGPDNPYAIASRLALALWDSVPDRALLDAAAHDRLSTREDVHRQAARMLNDARSRAKVRDFLHRWLLTEKAENVTKDPNAFPEFNAEVMSDFRTSLDLFLDDVVWQNGRGDYRKLLLSDELYVNDRLARFLDVPVVASGGGFVKVKVAADQRSGVLTHPYLLATLAYSRNTSPIHRGVFLTRNIVGRVLRPPPQAVSFDESKFDPSLTMREKVTELTRSASCMGCHSVINPLGFSLEKFDAVGRFRTTDNNKPVDATSEFRAGDGRAVRLAGPRDVAQFAAASPEAHRAFVRQLFQHAVKQPPEAYGAEVLERLRQSFAESGFDVRKLLVEIAEVSSLRESALAGSGE
jgi:hypothetical protein